MFLVPVRVLRTVFRGRSSSPGLCHLYRKGLLNLGGFCTLPPAILRRSSNWIAKLGEKELVRPCRAALRRPRKHVLRHLGRYTHRMAISNHRITAFDGERVSFLWRDYAADGGKLKVMTLDAVNFLCRFFLHVLAKPLRAHPPLWPALQPLPPKSYCLSRRAHCSPNRAANRCLFRHSLIAPRHCPRCGKAMRVVERFTAAELYFAALDSSRTPPPTRSDGLLPARLCRSVRIAPRTAPGYSQSHPEIAASRKIALPSDHRCPSSATKNRPTELLTASPNAIQYP